MNLMDTLIWLINFPVANGYTIIFVSAFSLFGCFAMARGASNPKNMLDAIRKREGLPSRDTPNLLVVFWGKARPVLFRILGWFMLASLVLGILGVTGVPVTRAYIHENGVPTTGTVDGDWVTFSTPDGTEYTLYNSFFSPAAYPDQHGYIPSGQPLVVRYLPSHPQAFVIDTDQIPD